MTSLFVRKAVDAGAQGAERAALLRSIGLDPQAAGAVEQRVADHAYYDLLERLSAQQTGCDLPLRIGGSMRCDDYGAFGLAWKTARRLRDSILRAERYGRLLTSVAEYELRPLGDDACFVLHRAGDRRLGLRLSNEATLASVTAIIREVSPTPFSPIEVQIKHPAPPQTGAHQTYFGCPVVFDAPLDALVISGADLDRRNRLADDGISRFLQSHLDTALLSLGAAPDLHDQVQDAIAQMLSEGVPKIPQVARRMGMSERTLQRRLGEAGLLFRSLVDQARRDLAEGLLAQSGYSLAEVAFLTGFSEQSAFNRAFRRWHDQTPAAFRQTALSRPD